jgi:hypothetical protein
MRVEGSQVDCCIREISLRGLLVQSAAPPARGTYIEIVHPGHSIVARVVWTNGRRFGVTTREQLNVAAIIRQANIPAPPRPKRLQAELSAPRAELLAVDLPHQAEQNRHRSTRLQFSFAVACGAIAAVVLAAGVHQQLNRSLGSVADKLVQVR